MACVRPCWLAWQRDARERFQFVSEELSRIHVRALSRSRLVFYVIIFEFLSLTLRFIISWSFVVVIYCASQPNKSSGAMRNETVYISVRKRWGERQLQWIKWNIIHDIKWYCFWSSLKVIELSSKFRRNHHQRCEHQIVHKFLTLNNKSTWVAHVFRPCAQNIRIYASDYPASERM